MKILVDSLLIEYQTNRPIQYELERNLMTCTAYRKDYLYSKTLVQTDQCTRVALAADASFVNTFLLMIDCVFIIPYVTLVNGDKTSPIA